MSTWPRPRPVIRSVQSTLTGRVEHLWHLGVLEPKPISHQTTFEGDQTSDCITRLHAAVLVEVVKSVSSSIMVNQLLAAAFTQPTVY